jgi:hypothetical protein
MSASAALPAFRPSKDQTAEVINFGKDCVKLVNPLINGSLEQFPADTQRMAVANAVVKIVSIMGSSCIPANTFFVLQGLSEHLRDLDDDAGQYEPVFRLQRLAKPLIEDQPDAMRGLSSALTLITRRRAAVQERLREKVSYLIPSRIFTNFFS